MEKPSRFDKRMSPLFRDKLDDYESRQRQNFVEGLGETSVEFSPPSSTTTFNYPPNPSINIVGSGWPPVLQNSCMSCGKVLQLGYTPYCSSCACSSVNWGGNHLKGSNLNCQTCQEYQSKQVYPWGNSKLKEGNTPIVKDNKKPDESSQITPEALQGGFKADQGKSKVSLIPGEFVLALADLFTMGAKKYSPNNWRLGMLYSRVYDAMQRHAWKYWNGEQNDSVDNQHHMISVAFGACVLFFFDLFPDKYKEFDDRPCKLSDSDIRKQ
jgi:hypothetical protein